MRVCGIHQPTFFPWLGYFDKMQRSDVFVFLDRANYQKSGSSMNWWCNRVKLNVSGSAAWVSCPVVRESGPQTIHTVRINDSRPWRNDVRKLLEINYRKARNYQPVLSFIDQLLSHETELIADFNINAIKAIAPLLGSEPEYVRETELPPSQALATERLVWITTTVRADAYLSGAAAADYLDEAAFPAAGLTLLRQNFEAKPYGPPGSFIPGLSVIDYLMHREE